LLSSQANSECYEADKPEEIEELEPGRQLRLK
jgi:hypothetical protein